MRQVVIILERMGAQTNRLEMERVHFRTINGAAVIPHSSRPETSAIDCIHLQFFFFLNIFSVDEALYYLYFSTHRLLRNNMYLHIKIPNVFVAACDLGHLNSDNRPAHLTTS